MSDDDIKYIDPPARWPTSKAVARTEGTRWWLREVMALKEQLIPFQWVPSFVGVSRAGVHYRAKQGNLTVFSYIVTELQTTLLGKTVERDTRTRFDFVSYSECLQWRELLQAKARQMEDGEDYRISLGTAEVEELERGKAELERKKAEIEAELIKRKKRK
jgi:hypothetical protein